MNNEALIVAGVRTPIGSMGGTLASVPAPELGALCVKTALYACRKWLVGRHRG